MGWSNFKSLNFQGPTGGIMFKKLGSKVSGSSGFQFFGDELAAGYNLMRLSGTIDCGFAGYMVDGSPEVISTTAYILDNYRCVLYGPITIANGTTLTVGDGAYVKVREWADV
tara:strand:- start:97 stop:432 length:336 start_codon:yes stop_codon:yes gene_type:complete